MNSAEPEPELSPSKREERVFCGRTFTITSKGVERPTNTREFTFSNLRSATDAVRQAQAVLSRVDLDIAESHTYYSDSFLPHLNDAWRIYSDNRLLNSSYSALNSSGTQAASSSSSRHPAASSSSSAARTRSESFGEVTTGENFGTNFLAGGNGSDSNNRGICQDCHALNCDFIFCMGCDRGDRRCSNCLANEEDRTLNSSTSGNICQDCQNENCDFCVRCHSVRTTARNRTCSDCLANDEGRRVLNNSLAQLCTECLIVRTTATSRRCSECVADEENLRCNRVHCYCNADGNCHQFTTEDFCTGCLRTRFTNSDRLCRSCNASRARLDRNEG